MHPLQRSGRDKQHYYFKLIPPRPTFPQDMTDKEKALMEKHGAYFQQQFDADFMVRQWRLKELLA